MKLFPLSQFHISSWNQINHYYIYITMFNANCGSNLTGAFFACKTKCDRMSEDENLSEAR